MSTGLTGTNQDLKKKAIEAMFIFLISPDFIWKR